MKRLTKAEEIGVKYGYDLGSLDIQAIDDALEWAAQQCARFIQDHPKRASVTIARNDLARRCSDLIRAGKSQ